MGTVRYTVANGQILAEKRAGNYRFYRSDGLGSTVSLYDSNQTKTDSFTYWPYGETRTSSGSSGTKYKFVGTLGCRTQADGGIYMRARVEQPKDGRWMTVDPIWPIEAGYSYAAGSPLLFVDPTGFRNALCNGPAFSCCICAPIDIPKWDYKRCKDCATAAGFKSIPDMCEALRNWDKQEPPVDGNSHVAALCCKLNRGACEAEANRRCKGAAEHDKCVHCVVSCCLAKKCGKKNALWCGWCNESRQLLDCKKSGVFDPKDHEANRWGVDHSGLKSCGDACRKYGAK